MKSGYYKCDFCYRFFVDKLLASRHETECLYNPERKHCNSCAYRKFVHDQADDSYSYKCEKGYDIDIRSQEVPCFSKVYKKASNIELKKRSETPEFK